MARMTIKELYEPAMEIKDQEKADSYFDFLVQMLLVWEPQPRVQAESIVRSNLGYYAGYYDDVTRERVERLYKCSHPILGAIAETGEISPEQAFELGVKLGRSMVAKNN